MDFLGIFAELSLIVKKTLFSVWDCYIKKAIHSLEILQHGLGTMEKYKNDVKHIPY
jgi:hypothetical protein